MNEQKDEKFKHVLYYVVEIAIRLGFLAILVVWCFQIIHPFAGVVLWAIIIALTLAPAHNALQNKIGASPKWSATLLTLFGLAVIVLPSWLFFESTISGLMELRARLAEGTLTIPPPTEKVTSWPLIGNKVYQIWGNASENLAAFITQYQEQIIEIAGTLLEKAMSIGSSILTFILAMIIGGILLVTNGTETTARKFFNKLVGTRGDEFTDVAAGTVRNVAKGVIGVALIQAFIVGIGLLLAGVPHAGLWALVVMVLAILQLPALLVIIPIVIWMFSVFNPVPATLWTVYLLAAGASDNFLKPMLLGKGAAVPMLVIFLGVLGGFMLSGFIGLFTGAIIISLGYKLFVSWLDDDSQVQETDKLATKNNKQ